MKALHLLAGAAALALATPSAAQPPAQTTDKKVLTLDGAKAVVTAAEGFARSKGVGGAVAVVDDGGNLLLLHRMDGTFAMGSTVSIGKARTAALFKKPTSFFEELVVQKGRVSMTALPDFTPLKGGVPIVVDGQIVGAVGVSGAMSADQDEEMALVAAKAVEAGPAKISITHIPADAVAAAFRKNEPLLATPEFQVNASHRDGPGVPEVHHLETDIFYVVSGKATLITGGTLVGAKSEGPHEMRGTALEGGETHELAPGDVLVVPAGTPHWFRTVDRSFDYYTVKSTR